MGFFSLHRLFLSASQINEMNKQKWIAIVYNRTYSINTITAKVSY